MAKILIAEDDRALLDMFSAAVESMGHSAIRAVNGRMAWEVLQANDDIAFLISDMAMPEMEGRDLIKLIRENRQFSTLPILIVSGAIRAREIAHLLEQGATHFMAKPVPLQDLMAVIKRYVP
jgi:CheY-like chemotaxis protein